MSTELKVTRYLEDSKQSKQKFKDRSKPVVFRMRWLWLNYRNTTWKHCSEHYKCRPSAASWPGTWHPSLGCSGRPSYWARSVGSRNQGMGLATAITVDVIVNVWLGRNLPDLFQDNKLHRDRKTVLFSSEDLGLLFLFSIYRTEN